MVKLKQQRLNQDSDARLRAEEGTRELEPGPTVALPKAIPATKE